MAKQKTRAQLLSELEELTHVMQNDPVKTHGEVDRYGKLISYFDKQYKEGKLNSADGKRFREIIKPSWG